MYTCTNWLLHLSFLLILEYFHHNKDQVPVFVPFPIMNLLMLCPLCYQSAICQRLLRDKTLIPFSHWLDLTLYSFRCPSSKQRTGNYKPLFLLGTFTILLEHIILIVRYCIQKYLILRFTNFPSCQSILDFSLKTFQFL
jgi:hypothetical protein